MVRGSNPAVGKGFHFVIFACFAFLAVRLSPYKLNHDLYIADNLYGSRLVPHRKHLMKNVADAL